MTLLEPADAARAIFEGVLDEGSSLDAEDAAVEAAFVSEPELTVQKSST